GPAMVVSALLVSLDLLLAPWHPLSIIVALLVACHLSHWRLVRAPPWDLLAGIPDLTLVSPADAEVCCGSAGVYNLLEPTTAAELGARKAAALRATGADVVAAGNPGCLLQIAASLRAADAAGAPTSGADAPTSAADPARPAVLHTVQILDASLRGPRS